MMLYPLMCVTFHPLSDGRRHSSPSFVFVGHLNRIRFRQNEKKVSDRGYETSQIYHIWLKK